MQVNLPFLLALQSKKQPQTIKYRDNHILARANVVGTAFAENHDVKETCPAGKTSFRHESGTS